MRSSHSQTQTARSRLLQRTPVARCERGLVIRPVHSLKCEQRLFTPYSSGERARRRRAALSALHAVFNARAWRAAHACHTLRVVPRDSANNRLFTVPSVNSASSHLGAPGSEHGAVAPLYRRSAPYSTRGRGEQHTPAGRCKRGPREPVNNCLFTVSRCEQSSH